MGLNFYCESCEQLVCHYCTINKHAGHTHNSVKKMAKKQRTELDKMMEPVKEMIDKLSDAHQNIITASEEIEAQTSEVDHQIDEYYDQLLKRPQQQREDLKRHSYTSYLHRKKAVQCN